MADWSNPREKLSAAGIRLRRGETALAALTFADDRTGVKSGSRGCIELTNQRMLHISGPSAEAQIKSTPLQDVGDAVLARQQRYLGFFPAAGYLHIYYFLIYGASYLIATAVAGDFHGSVLIPTLLLGGGFLAVWWYSGGDTVIRVELGDTQLEGVTGSGQQREVSAFLAQLTEVKGKRT